MSKFQWTEEGARQREIGRLVFRRNLRKHYTELGLPLPDDLKITPEEARDSMRHATERLMKGVAKMGKSLDVLARGLRGLR